MPIGAVGPRPAGHPHDPGARGGDGHGGVDGHPRPGTFHPAESVAAVAEARAAPPPRRRRLQHLEARTAPSTDSGGARSALEQCPRRRSVRCCCAAPWPGSAPVGWFDPVGPAGGCGPDRSGQGLGRRPGRRRLAPGRRVARPWSAPAATWPPSAIPGAIRAGRGASGSPTRGTRRPGRGRGGGRRRRGLHLRDLRSGASTCFDPTTGAPARRTVSATVDGPVAGPGRRPGDGRRRRRRRGPGRGRPTWTATRAG